MTGPFTSICKLVRQMTAWKQGPRQIPNSAVHPHNTAGSLSAARTSNDVDISLPVITITSRGKGGTNLDITAATPRPAVKALQKTVFSVVAAPMVKLTESLMA